MRSLRSSSSSGWALSSSVEGQVLAERLDVQVRQLRRQLEGVAGRPQALLQDGAGLLQLVVPAVDGRQLQVQAGVGRVGLELARIGAASRPARSVGGRRAFGLGGGRRRRGTPWTWTGPGRTADRRCPFGLGTAGVGHGPLVVAAGDGLVDGQVLELAVGLLVGRLGLAHQVPQGDGLGEVAALLVEAGQGAVERGQLVCVFCRACSSSQTARSSRPSASAASAMSIWAPTSHGLLASTRSPYSSTLR